MPYTYQAPLRDMRFAIEQVLEAPAHWAACPTLSQAGVDMDTAVAVLEEAARFASQVLQPLNAPGDREGCSRDAAGQVSTPAGFPAAYRAFVEGGWPALACSTDWGGQGLPLLVDAALREMLSACNHGWNMYPDLLHGAYETLKAHASEALKAAYLPKVASGEWLAAMALTEPGAGSDLGALRTTATALPDGSAQVSGEKIFISGADHDLTDNIVHLVLCRLNGPDGPAPAGTQGLSLVLVPKWLPDGRRNTWLCTGLEHKLGIHGSATCSVRYEAATGWLVGERHRGLAAMFLMMNSARLHVGLQGLGHQEMATQNALRYALERVQMKRPIAEHPAVRHLLLESQASTEAQRVLAYAAALALDDAAHQPEAAQRAVAQRRAALLTPVVKAWCTQRGFEVASQALQVFGGYGYVEETGVAQTLRDSRIAMVYEGTNEIQAIDLLQRKWLADGGLALREWLADAESEAQRCEALAAQPGAWSALLLEAAQALRGQLSAVQAAHQHLQPAPGADLRSTGLAVAGEVLAGFAHALMAWAWAATARALVVEPDPDFAQAKAERVRYGLQWCLPQAQVHWQRVMTVGTDLPPLRVTA
jgi:alkylation response protein AidB-like acyl-CoA dehydrogenase